MSYSGDPHEAVYIRASNYDMGVGELPSKVESLVVWGGVSANCGEDNLSRIVDKNSFTLKRMIFVPEKTKGGVLVRPKYYRDDRAGRAQFPALNFMAITAEAHNPYKWGWDTPSLTDLVIVARDERFDSAASLSKVARSTFLDIRKHSPLLQRIYFRRTAFCFDNGNKEWLPLTLGAGIAPSRLMDAFTVLAVHGPCGADWSQVRVILAARGRSTRSDCLISKLPYNVLQYIVQFMGRGNFLLETPSERGG